MSRLARVGQVAEQIRGVTYAKEDAATSPQPGYLPILRAGNITDFGLSFDDLVYVPGGRVSAKQRVRRNDVVIAASSGSLDVVGKAARVTEDFDGGFGAFCKVLRPGPEVHPGYFSHFFRTPEYRNRISSLAAGANINNLRGEHLDNLQIPLPPLDEQCRIAAILDKADELRAKRRTAIAKLDTLTQSIFLDMFGDPALASRTIGSLRESGELLLHKDGNHGSLYPRPADFGNEGVPFLSAKAVGDDGLIDGTLIDRLRIDKAAKLRIGWISQGDVLLAHNASVGKVALYTGLFGPALIGTSLTAFRPNPESLDSRYLFNALRSPRFQRELQKNMGQTTRNQVPITAQRGLAIPVPPIIQQREFARRASSVDCEAALQRSSLVKVEALLSSLAHRAFRGEL